MILINVYLHLYVIYLHFTTLIVFITLIVVVVVFVFVIIYNNNNYYYYYSVMFEFSHSIMGFVTFSDISCKYVWLICVQERMFLMLKRMEWVRGGGVL